MLTCSHESSICVKTKSTKKRKIKEHCGSTKLCLIKRLAHEHFLFFFVLIQKRTKKNQARTLPLYPLLAALQPHMPEWAALFVHVHAHRQSPLLVTEIYFLFTALRSVLSPINKGENILLFICHTGLNACGACVFRHPKKAILHFDEHIFPMRYRPTCLLTSCPV